MLTSERRELLLHRLAKEGRIVAKTVAQELGLSEDTVRRDLRDLARQGKLQRVHGGALPASPATAGFNERKSVAIESKAALARHAIAMIEPGQIVFLDGGTTNGLLAQLLPPDLAISVITHSPSVAVALAAHPSIEVEMIGGHLFKHSIVNAGTAAAGAIGRVRPDLCVMGVTGLHPDIGATTGDAEEAQIKALIAFQSAETMVLASAEKLGAASPHLILPLDEIATVVIENTAPQTTVQALQQAGSTVVFA